MRCTATLRTDAGFAARAIEGLSVATATSAAASPHHIRQLMALGRRLMAEPAATRHLLIHCGAGFSRSPAALALMLAQAIPAIAPGDIAAEVLRLRSTAWPNLRIIELGDSLLGRSGSWSRPHRGYAVIVSPTNQGSPSL